jgi:2-oxo-4-hydroxy-4-carboxy-5-ureidoimidazoline decarboxylase
MVTLADANRILEQGGESAMGLLGSIYEKSPWVVTELLKQKKLTFDSVTEIAAVLKKIVDSQDKETRLKLIQAHPDLAGKAALAGDVTDESKAEQARAGLSTLTRDEMDEFNHLNDAYKSKFGFPFILAVRNATKFTILDAFRARLDNSTTHEFDQCMAQIHKIAWMRLLTTIEWKPVGFLTCHVLDTARGCPAAGMRITLSKIDNGTSKEIRSFVTNDDGRTGRALDGHDFAPGTYEWVFHCGPYFAKSGLNTSGTPFLDDVPIRFGIDNPEDHYHVPLLVSPWSFSTYRGS